MTRAGRVVGIVAAALTLTSVALTAGRLPQGAGTIAGRVTDSSGAPIRRTFVRAVEVGPAGTAYESRLSRGAYTDADGRYEIPDVPAETYWVFVEASHVTHPADVPPSPVLPPSRLLERPAPRFTSADGGFYWPVPAMAPGELPPIRPDGREAVFVTTAYPSADDVNRSTPVVVEAGQVRSGVDIVMRAAPRVSVRGTVVVPPVTTPGSWRPVLRLRGPDESWSGDSWSGVAITRARLDGTFEFLSAPQGEWTLDVFRMQDGSDVARNDPLGMTAQMTLSIGDQDIDGLELRLAPGATVRARLEFDGPAPGADPRYLSMRLGSIGRSLGNGAWETTPEAFVATGVAPGAYRFFPRIDGWHLASVTRGGRDITGQPFEVAREDVDDLVVSFARHPTEIVGVVQTLAESDRADTRVVLFPADPDRFGAASFERAEVSDVGAFAFHDVVPGTYFVAAVSTSALDDWPARSALVELSQVARLVIVPAGEMVMIDLERSWP